MELIGQRSTKIWLEKQITQDISANERETSQSLYWSKIYSQSYDIDTYDKGHHEIVTMRPENDNMYS